jgi:hypothetical protein
MGTSSEEADLHRLMKGSLSGDSGSHRELLKLLTGHLRAYFRRKLTGGGCNLNRKIDDLIRSAGFDISELQTKYLPGPRPLTYTYRGLAR